MENRHILFIHILIALIVALVLYISTKPLLSITETILVTDAIAAGSILSTLFFFLKNIVKYSHFSSLLLRQRLINYSALGLLFVTGWLGIEYIVLYISFPAGEWEELLPTLPIRIVIAMLIYCLIILIYPESIHENGNKPEEDGRKEEAANVLPEKNEEKAIEPIERIVVKNGQKIDVIMIPEIICITAEGDYVMIHTGKGKFLKEQTMKSLEVVLPSDKFVRVHRSSIVNVEFIAQIELYNKQNQLLKLKNGIQVKISLTGYKILRDTLGL
ncbi:LytR/AlgR family response regulator transcription factor [Dysgonomonas reticulitermitis]